MKKLNEFFFGEEVIHPSDFIWWYGGLTFFIAVTVCTVIATL